MNMKNISLTRLSLAIGLAFAGSAGATTWDFSGSNIYMKFLDGNQRAASTSSIDTASGADQGQFTEMNLVFKAQVSPQVEAGGRIQSRSSASYWTDFGGFGNEGSVNGNINDMKFMKLRGAYVELSPGYSWLSNARIGSNDWGMFDPFTVGKVRYIDRDNYNGFYFRGPVARGATWEFARVSLPNYLQFNYGQGATCCSTDATQYNEATYIGQLKGSIGGAKLTGSYQSFTDHKLGTTNNPSDPFAGYSSNAIYKNTVVALKAEGSPTDAIDLKGAYYRSNSDTATGTLGENWGNAPKTSISDGAFKLDVGVNQTPVKGLTLNAQLFNIGAGYFSNTAARRETDVLLTEGSESAWYKWGNPIWSGGAVADYTQSASSPNGRPGVPNGTQNGLTDNAFMDFDESPAESVVGWKGSTFLFKYDPSSTPMSLELTHVGYNNNWQSYSATGPLSNVFPLYQDRTTSIAVFKVNHIFPLAGGLDTNFKYKRIGDKDGGNLTIASDDREVTDTGYSFSVGNQLMSQVYGTLSWGNYKRDVVAGVNTFNNHKNILSARLAYNLPGYEVGVLAQKITGTGYPTETVGTEINIDQYRLKAFAQVNF
jgi:hypothetical protein